MFEDDFPFPQVGYVSSLEGILWYPRRWQLNDFLNFHPDPWGNDPIWLTEMSSETKPPWLEVPAVGFPGGGGQMYSFPETNSKKHLKMDGWNTTVVSFWGETPLFSGAMLAVSFRGGVNSLFGAIQKLKKITFFQWSPLWWWGWTPENSRFRVTDRQKPTNSRGVSL